MKCFCTALLILCAWFLAASGYQVTVLGDTHFDAGHYHASKPVNEYQKLERERNISMWENGASAAVLRAAAAKTTADVPFVIQAGDLTQGDCDDAAAQGQMVNDGFKTVKSFFKGKKLLTVQGNHDVRLASGKCEMSMGAKAFFPALEREVGKPLNNGNYFVRHGRDLYIFFAAFKITDKEAVDFVSGALDQNKDARHVFYITHVPLLAWSYTQPLPGCDKIVSLLLSRNAVILCGHTHRSSILTIAKDGKKLTQFVVSSIGSDWKNTLPFEVSFDTVDKYMMSKKESYRKRETVIKRLAELKKYPITLSEVYSIKSGFAILNVKEDTVAAELYLDDSGKPVKTFILKGNNK